MSHLSIVSQPRLRLGDPRIPLPDHIDQRGRVPAVLFHGSGQFGDALVSRVGC
jgi:hypothetical protein